MLDEVLTIKVDPLWLSCLEQLAKQAGRNRSAFVRDIVYLLTVSDVGKDFCKLLVSEGVKYGS